MDHKTSRDAILDLIRERVERSDNHNPEEQSKALAALLAVAWETRRPLAESA